MDVWTTGTGPSVLLVHRSGADHESWLPLLPHLAGRFTLHALRVDGAVEARDVALSAAGLDAHLVVADADAAGPALAGLPDAGRGATVVLLDPPGPVPPTVATAATVHVLAGAVTVALTDPA